MNQTLHTILTRGRLLAALALLALFFAAPLQSVLAQTAGGTPIINQASASYTDGSPTTYNAISNTVTVTVANVSGLSITPDDTTGASNPTVVAGQQNVDFIFTVENDGNYDTQVRFLQSGASVRVVSGPGAVVAAVIDDGDGVYEVTDTDIWTNNGADVISGVLLRGSGAASQLRVIVRVNINAGATAGQIINVQLGDAASDNVSTGANPPSANEVRTSSGGAASPPVNGESEAVGNSSASVQNDAQLRVTLAAPAGPISLGSDINYATQVCSTGQRDVSAITLGGVSGVFIVAPIPAGTALKAGQPFTGSVQTLYSTDALATTSPAGPPPVGQPAASWSAVAPGDLTTVRRVAFKVGNTLVVGACSATIPYDVTVTTSDASQPIREMVDAFGANNVSAKITDQSDGQSVGAQIAGQGDGNALGAPTPQPNPGISGTPILTPLAQVGSVLIGPSGVPAAVGPTDNNDDFTNKNVSAAAIAGVAPGGNTNSSSVITFTNTVRNNGNANDTFTLTAQTVAAGLTLVEVSTNGGASWTTVSGGGSTTLAINFGQQADITVRITTAASIPVLAPYAAVIRATSANTPASYNETIDRLYSGFLRLTKTATVINGTGVGGATDAVPGAHIEYEITYKNISLIGPAGNVMLTARSIVITEDGTPSPGNPSNWAANTTQVIAPMPTDNTGGVITDGAGNPITPATTVLRDAVPDLAPDAEGKFTFRRRIN